HSGHQGQDGKRASDAKPDRHVINLEIPLIRSLPPTSVPIAQIDTDGHCSQIAVLNANVAIVFSRSHPDPSSPRVANHVTRSIPASTRSTQASEIVSVPRAMSGCARKYSPAVT